MKVYQIEDTIIAYFDGRLTDAERAELLHRVSVSPEIRDLFQQHEMMRDMSLRAARNVTVRPAIEEAVFANVAAMIQKDSRRAVGFWTVKRGAIAGVVAALFAVGLAESYEPTSVSSRMSTIASTHVTSDVQHIQWPKSDAPSQDYVSNHSLQPITFASNNVVAEEPAPIENSETTIEYAVAPLPLSSQAEHIQPPGIIGHGIPRLDIADASEVTRWELGAQTSTQSTWPAGIATAGPFSDFAAHIAYSIGMNDLIGVQFEHGLMSFLNVQQLNSAGVSIYTATTPL
jgi:hypothetical protein